MLDRQPYVGELVQELDASHPQQNLNDALLDFLRSAEPKDLELDSFREGLKQLAQSSWEPNSKM